MKKIEYDDVPQILSSISWQLKRIADALEHKNELNKDCSKVQPLETLDEANLNPIQKILRGLHKDS